MADGLVYDLPKREVMRLLMDREAKLREWRRDALANVVPDIPLIRDLERRIAQTQFAMNHLERPVLTVRHDQLEEHLGVGEQE